MKINIKGNERIDDLEINNYKIIQNTKDFCFGIDSVLLSDFAKNIKKDANVIDLGCGNGIIPILLCAKTKPKKIVGIEIQKDVADMAKRNIELNNLGDKFEIINKNILDILNDFKKQSFDVVITNPPYKKRNTGIINESENKIISRHEITADLEDFIRTAKDLLKDKGEFYMVHKPERLVDILHLMRKYKLEPKILRMVYSNIDKEPTLILIKGIKNANEFLKVEKNLYIYDKNGEYTNEIKKIYNKN